MLCMFQIGQLADDYDRWPSELNRYANCIRFELFSPLSARLHASLLESMCADRRVLVMWNAGFVCSELGADIVLKHSIASGKSCNYFS